MSTSVRSTRLTWTQAARTAFERGNTVLNLGEQAAAELGRENERLERFASVVSHDLRSPLSVATGYMQMAYEEGDEEAYERVVNSLERMDEIIDDVLAVTRQGGEVTDPTAVDLAALARSAWDVTEAESATLTADSVTVEGDGDQLQRLFENLFRNAIEHGNATELRVGPLDGEERFYVGDNGRASRPRTASKCSTTASPPPTAGRGSGSLS